MAESETEPLLHPCPGCSEVLDVSEEQPFSQVHCPSCGQAMRVRCRFGQYELQEILGTGGMGAVYKAVDQSLNRPVAIKLLRREFSSNPEFLAKFENEAKITASINHPHVVKVFSFGQDHGVYYIAMEIVDKGSLDDLMHQLKRLPEGQALEVAIQITMGLQAAHRAGLIHRDVKPGNILFADAHTAKIVDFGLALLVADEASQRGEVWGTPYYVAPEKLRHEPEDFRSDMYSLGGTVFHAISGEPPFEADTPSLIARRHLDDEPPSIQEIAPDVSIATAFVLDKTLKKDPAERYQSYEELIEHLTYARTKLLEATGRSRFQAMVNMVQEHAVGLILIVLLFGLGVFAVRNRESLFKKPPPQTSAQESTRTQRVASREVEMKYLLGQKQLLEGKYEKAQETFWQLGRQDVPQPLANWIRFHEGLASLFINRPQEAEAIFKKMSGGMHPDNPADAALANFFASAGTLLGDDKTIDPKIANSYDTPNQETIALLAFALKNWDLGSFDEAKRFFQRFLIADPKEQYTWISDYKQIAEKYMADYRIYDGIATKLAAATSVEEKSKILTTLLKQRENLQTRGAMVKQLDAIAGKLKNAGATLLADQAPEPMEPPKPDPTPTEPMKPDPDRRQAESRTWEAARAKYAALCAVYNFTDARAALAPAVLTEPDFVQQKTAALRRVELLRIFKATLINDVNAIGYPQAIFKKNNISLPAGAHRATETQLSIVSQFGSVPAQWSEIAPMSVLLMADYFSRRSVNADAAADRHWLLGIFAMELGMEREGNAYLDRAAQGKPTYREQRPLLFPASEPVPENSPIFPQ